MSGLKTKRILVPAILLGIFSMVGCLFSSDSGDVLPARYFKDSVQSIFDGKCIECHVVGGYGWSLTGGDSGGLDLTAPNSYKDLINRPAFQHKYAPDLVPNLLVKPGDADSSYLYLKVSSAAPGYLNPMPWVSRLTPSEINAIKRWIEAGAPLGDTTTH